jgi:hypothetical protein
VTLLGKVSHSRGSWVAFPTGGTEGHTPNHCSAPYSSNRATSTNPSFAARRIERVLAVWVVRTAVSPGNASANQPSAAVHASAAYPCPHAVGSNM